MVTGEQVKQAAEAAGIKEIDHHDCGGCGYMTKYIIENGQLYFDPGCDCVRRASPPEPHSWDSAAEWINMQVRSGKWGDVGAKIAAKFGLTLSPAAETTDMRSSETEPNS